jgi:hypothetical protein
VPGTRASSMVAECMSMLREKRSTENGSMARGLDGSRTEISKVAHCCILFNPIRYRYYMGFWGFGEIGRAHV